jgi:purine-cytosine permease-like protein
LPILEQHGVDFIPLSERHGHPRDLATLWFGGKPFPQTAFGGVDTMMGTASLAITLGCWFRIVTLGTTFLISWSSINLVDYYWIRRGRYNATDLFTPLGRYGKFNGAGIGSYLLGCLGQIPFISQEFYAGPVAGRLRFDVAWVVGLIVPGGIYYGLARKLARASPSTISSTVEGPR